jgi:chromosome partitioning protein
MALVVSFINFKGGVGKTTLSVEIAASLYKKFNSRVLMIDLDPQSNCTLYWLNEQDWETKINAHETLLAFFQACLADRPFDLTTIIATPTRFARTPWYERFDLRVNRGIKLIPSDMELFGVDLKLAQRFGLESLKAQTFLKKLFRRSQTNMILSSSIARPIYISRLKMAYLQASSM